MSVAVALGDYHKLTIADVRRETHDAISVAFELPHSLRNTFAFKPGQHLGVRAMLQGQEERRSYSICSGPDDEGLRIAIKRVAGGSFSVWANDTFASGQLLDVLPPAGRFVLPRSEGAPRHVLAFAAGSGITPIMAMIRYALAREPETRLTLVYGNRTPEATLFREQLEDLKDKHLERFTLLNILSRNSESDLPLLEGRITGEKVKMLAGKLVRLDHLASIFLCGPGTMIKDVRTALFELGVPRPKIHHEFFAAGGGAYRQPHASAAPPVAAGAATEIAGTQVVAILDGKRHSFIVPLGGHVVDAALSAGVRVPFSCKGGMCCTCRARVVEGQAHMTLNYSLEPWEIERGYVLTCQAVPSTPSLVLDYDQM